MSFWALTVITNLVTIVPAVGPTLLTYLWGGMFLSGFTIQRFFSLHYILPMGVIVCGSFHILFLHEFGSSNEVHLNGGASD